MVDFVSILKTAGSSIISRADETTNWYRGRVRDMARVNKSKDPSQLFAKKASPEIGKMYMYMYEAKHKDTLPFYDAFPLIFPINFYSDGFLGINLHYLPPMARAALLTSLTDIATNNKYNSNTKLSISYDLLKSYANKFKGFENCVKRYLYGHVRSQFHLVHPNDWGKVVLLPLQKWKINPNKKYAGSPPY
jgi:hypothetical protein